MTKGQDTVVLPLMKDVPQVTHLTGHYLLMLTAYVTPFDSQADNPDNITLLTLINPTALIILKILNFNNTLVSSGCANA